MRDGLKGRLLNKFPSRPCSSRKTSVHQTKHRTRFKRSVDLFSVGRRERVVRRLLYVLTPTKYPVTKRWILLQYNSS